MRATRTAIALDLVPDRSERLMVTITRVGVRYLDGDNLAGGCKAIRDGIAQALGRDDADARWGGSMEWRYEQEKAVDGRRGGARYGIRIRIE